MKTREYIETIEGVGNLQIPGQEDREVGYEINVFQTVEQITTLDRAQQSVGLLKSSEVRLSGLDEWFFMEAEEGTLTIEDGRTMRLLLLNPIKALSGLESPSI